jgi:hypothetical protein
MIFHINTKKIKEYDIHFDSLLILLGIYFNTPVRVLEYPEELKGYYLIHPELNKPYLTQKGVNIVEEVFLKSEFTNKEENLSLEDLAEKLRELYPKGKKPGTAYMWRDSTAYIVKRLQAFEKKYGKFDHEDIIKATQKYVNSFNGNYGYMQLLKYFIFKDDTSQLLSYISNLDDEDDCQIDWNTALK